MEADGDHFLAYYLTKEDGDAIEFKESRLAHTVDDPQEDQVRATTSCVFPTSCLCELNASRMLQPTFFHFVRDYETVKVEQEVPNEFLLVLDEGTDEFDSKRRVPRPKGAYYKNIERKMLLKKKRVNVRPFSRLLS